MVYLDGIIIVIYVVVESYIVVVYGVDDDCVVLCLVVGNVYC